MERGWEGGETLDCGKERGRKRGDRRIRHSKRKDWTYDPIRRGFILGGEEDTGEE